MRRGIIRHTVLVIDASLAMNETDFKPYGTLISVDTGCLPCQRLLSFLWKMTVCALLNNTRLSAMNGQDAG